MDLGFSLIGQTNGNTRFIAWPWGAYSVYRDAKASAKGHTLGEAAISSECPRFLSHLRTRTFAYSMPPIHIPSLSDTSFKLDTAAVAGFFGGEECISAMATLHLEKGRKWLGWYNTPGSYHIAKHYGELADSRFWRSLFPGRRDSLATALKLDGVVGPTYVGAYSGTKLSTGHLAYLLSEKCKREHAEPTQGRETTATYLNVISLSSTAITNKPPIPRIPYHTVFAAIFTIFTSLACSIVCALENDWICASMIWLGMAAGGVSTLVLGSGEVKFSDTTVTGSIPGDGVLIGPEVTVLKGPEELTDVITRGCLRVKLEGDFNRQLELVGFCSLFLLIQFLLQLLLIPQGTLMGQVFFVVSLVVSWAYTGFFLCQEHISVQHDFLWQRLGKPNIRRFKFNSRTAMVVFALLVLDPLDAMEIVDELLPKNHIVWMRWRQILAQRLNSRPGSAAIVIPESQSSQDALSRKDQRWLDDIVGDIDTGFRVFEDFVVRSKLAADSEASSVGTLEGSRPLSHRVTHTAEDN